VIHSLGELIPSHPALDLASVTTLPTNPSAHEPLLSPPLRAGEKENAPRQIFICGGAQVYAQALPLCSDLYLTLVKRTVEGDTYFPPFEEQFELAEELRDTPEFQILHYRNRQS
jgi:dihydrofolate reductase